MTRALAQKLAAQIRLTGPISVAQFMQAALYDPQHGYYTRAAEIARDFITAPESSQMFGELIGLWCVHEWQALGAPESFDLIEFGPGSGALLADALRAARLEPAFLAAARVSLIEISPALRAAQKEKLDALGVAAHWRDAPPPPGAPALLIANEFLDCLPIRQYVRSGEGWRERMVGAESDGALSFRLGPPLPGGPDAPPGAVREEAPGLAAQIERIGAHLQAAPGRALIIDYAGDGMGDTLQALRAHQKLDPLAAPGESDLTARVDFTALQRAAKGLRIDGPVPQAHFLRALGLDQRAEALIRQHPQRAERIAREHARLTAPAQMGTLFQAICLSSPHLPPAAGF